MYYIGVDLAWTYKNETGFCVLDDNLNCIFCDADIYSDSELIKMINLYEFKIVSVDAPLIVKNETGGRNCDSLLMKHAIHNRYLKLYATSRNYMLRTFKTIRGEELYRLLLKEGFVLGEDLTETYPTGIFLSLMPELFDNKYKLSSRLSLEVLLTHAREVLDVLVDLGVKNMPIELETIKTKKAYKHVEDQIDALLCAVHCYYFDKRESITFIGDDNGSISLPVL
ncbi:MAG: DUF429 domain-containing protein [Clostridiales bacterium]|nr:DUF429 domain-containing protein [Clostridiales bacterium]